MANTISRTEYETLTADLILEMVEVKDVSTLFRAECRVLKADVTVLLERSPFQSEVYRVVGTYPNDRFEWANENLPFFRSWYEKIKLTPEIPGGASERPVRIGQERFTEALVAFGLWPPTQGYPTYEILLLRKEISDKRFSSYHAFIAAALLRHYEQLDRLRTTLKDKEVYAGLISLNILLECDWNEFVAGVEREASEKLAQPDFMGPATVVACAYRLWARSKCTKKAFDWSPYGWLKQQSGGEEWELYKAIVENLESGENPHRPSALDPIIFEEVRKRIKKIGDDNWKAALIVLESGWRVVYRATESRAIETKQWVEDNSFDNYLEALLVFTSTMALMTLQKDLPQKNHRTRIDRDALRAYLAIRVCHARRLRRRYMRVGSGADTTHRQVADEVRREFLFNLSRFMLGVVAAFEKGSQVVADPSLVSSVEVLDGLLYIVDRFAHVELGVDERLHFRERLGRGLPAEVHRHLNQRFYRDHMIHVIDVFLLGLCLLGCRASWSGHREQTLIEYISGQRLAGPPTTQGHIKPADLLREWAVAALLHDLDYQLLEPSQDLDSSDAAKRFFELPRGSSIGWIDMANRSQDPWKTRLQDFLAHCQADRDGWLPPPADYDIGEHGVLSAFRVAQILAHADSESPTTTSSNPLPLLKEFRYSLHAVAYHNLFDQRVQFDTHPLSCLLRLCDELQEWGRRRVDIEHMVKHLYLQIEQNDVPALDAHESLEWLDANLYFEPEPIAGAASRLSGDSPILDFRLIYGSPLQAKYDAITTFLLKAYNLQHIELPSATLGHTAMEWRLQLVFPRPKEYLGLTELDIYGLLKERVRVLPALLRFTDLDKAESGLLWLTPLPPPPEFQAHDFVAISVNELAKPTSRCGWQTCHPGKLVSSLIELKRQMLTRRVLGKKGEWLTSPEDRSVID